MERFPISIQRWIIPCASALLFFWVLAFVVPYSTSLGEIKQSLGQLVEALAFLPSAPGHEAIDYTYCLFVPLIFAWLVYLRRKDLAEAPIQGSNLALAVLGFGILLYWFGIRANVQYFGYAALQVFIAGIILWFWGWAVFRILIFPWAFFLFTWPLPFLDSTLAFPLRLKMCWLVGKILPLMGVPLVQNGTSMLSPPDPLQHLQLGEQFQVDVADPCSGIRSLSALLMFSALFGYLFVPRLWQQWLIFLSAFPLAILGNVVRIILLVLGSIWFGSAFAVGVKDPSIYHEACGFLVYGVALGSELLLASLLTRKWRKPPPSEAASSGATPA